MKDFFNFNIILRISIIAVLSMGAGWSFFGAHEIVLGIVFTTLAFTVVVNLVSYQNRINERINYFFESIKNNDFSQIYPNRKGDKIIRRLNQNMNAVNQQIQQIKIESQQQDQYFRALIEHVGTGILTYDQKGFVLHANGAIKQMLGMRQLTHMQQLARVDESLFNALRNFQENDQRLLSFSGKEGKISISVKASSFRNNDQQLTLLSVQDINKELSEKELDSWLKLIRVLTHEIMNSIAPVTSLSETLANYFRKDGQPIPPEAVNEQVIATTIRGLDIIREQGRGLIDFVESYRKLTRLPQPEKKQLDALSLLEKIILLDRAANNTASITINLAMQDNRATIMADENQIVQVLLNLIKNSRAALGNQPGGQIRLTTGTNSNGQFEISVTDNGPGIPPELLEEIFVPFFTTREQGSGIGLSLSRQIMRLHGGSLKVQSIPNKETTFTLKFY